MKGSPEEQRAILAALENADAEVRRLALEQVGLLPDYAALRHLREALGDAEWRVRKVAVERVVRFPAPSVALEMLVGCLSDGDNPGRRNSAMEALVASGARVVSRLVRELSSPDEDVRKLAVDALAELGDDGVREPLVATLADADVNVRAAAAEALGVLGGPDEVPPLMQVACAGDEPVLVRVSALRALVRMQAPVSVEDLDAALEESLLRPAALELLGFCADPRAVDVLLKALAGRGRRAREAAMAALLRRYSALDDGPADGLVERLREAARSDESLVDFACERVTEGELCEQLAAIQFAGLLDAPATVLPVLRAAHDEALEELVHNTLVAGAEASVAALVEGWEELDAEARRRACAVLGEVGTAPAEALLTATLQSVHPELRLAAIDALGEGRFRASLPALLRGLEVAAELDEADAGDEIDALIHAIVATAERAEAADPGSATGHVELVASRLGGASEPVRRVIAAVLSRLGRARDRDVIETLSKDVSPEVRRAAVGSLARFGFDVSGSMLWRALADEDARVQREAIRVLGEFDAPEAREALERLLERDDPSISAGALRALGSLFARASGTDEAACERLAVAADADPMVALASLEALAAVGGDAAARVALAQLDRPEAEVARAAVACVGAHGSDGTLSALLACLVHPDWSVRAEAICRVADRGYRPALPALLRRLELEDDAFVREALLDSTRRLEGACS